jgi:hypothetical protein
VIGDASQSPLWISAPYDDETAGWFIASAARQITEAELIPSPTPAPVITPSPLAAAQAGTATTAPSPAGRIVSTSPTAPATTTPPGGELTPSMTRRVTATPTPDGTNANTVVLCPTEIANFPFAPQSEIQTAVPAPGCVTVTPLLSSSSATATPSPTPLPIGPIITRDIALSAMGGEQFQMVSPNGAAQFFFTLPSNWFITAENTLHLKINFGETYNSIRRDDERGLVSQLDILLDSEVISSVLLTEANIGEQVIEVPLPAERLANMTLRSHTIELRLNAQGYCDFPAEAQVSGSADESFVQFRYRETLPVLDLAMFPRPLFHEPFRTDVETVWIVIPDSPSLTDLEALISIAVGLGASTNERLQIELAAVGSLTEEVRRTNNLVVVGKVGANGYIDALYRADLLPTILSADGDIGSLDGRPITSGDGIIQLIGNPENNQRAVLVVTGQTDEALLKASRSLVGLGQGLGATGNLVVTADSVATPLAPDVDAVLEGDVFSLSDIGYPEDFILYGSGFQTVDIAFVLPRDVLPQDGAYLDLLYDYSELLNSHYGTLTVALNGSPIGSLAFTEDAAGDENSVFRRLRIPLPADNLFPTYNVLTLAVDARIDWGCREPNQESVWFKISSDSNFFVPRTKIDRQIVPHLVEDFPFGFISTPDLNDLWFSLPAQPKPYEITQLMDLATRIGHNYEVSSVVLRPHVSLGQLPRGTDLSKYNFVVIGRPTTNDFLADFSESLPQPMEPGTDELAQVLGTVNYRLIPGLDVGVLQTLSSPWNEDRALLVVSGTSDEGQRHAGETLMVESAGRANGDVVFTTGDRVAAVYSVDVGTTLDVLRAAQAVIVASATAPGVDGSGVITPAPASTEDFEPLAVSVTPSNTPNPAVVAVQVTAIISATPPPTALVFPTFEPLSQVDLMPIDTEPPGWVNTLVLVSGIVIALIAVVGLFVFIRSRMAGGA